MINLKTDTITVDGKQYDISTELDSNRRSQSFTISWAEDQIEISTIERLTWAEIVAIAKCDIEYHIAD